MAHVSNFSRQLSQIPKEDLIEVLSLPKNSSTRLCELKLTQIELETKRREDSAGEIDRLTELLKIESDKYLALKQLVDKDEREKVQGKMTMLKQSREAEFYRDKINQFIMNSIESSQNNTTASDQLNVNLKLSIREILAKRDTLKKLNKSLEEYQNLEPTNEALQRKIDELKKSRLSLEMTFVDDSTSSF